eukprot:3843697-Rhodomonas_salina.1
MSCFRTSLHSLCSLHSLAPRSLLSLLLSVHSTPLTSSSLLFSLHAPRSARSSLHSLLFPHSTCSLLLAQLAPRS